MNNVLRCRIAQPTSGADGVKIAVLRKGLASWDLLRPLLTLIVISLLIDREVKEYGRSQS